MNLHPGSGAVVPPRPSEQTLIDVRFDTLVDGPGVHGEVIQIDSNDPAGKRRPPLQGEITFRITTAEDR